MTERDQDYVRSPSFAECLDNGLEDIQSLSFDIKLACELERIWIMLNLDEKSALSFQQVVECISKMDLKFTRLSNKQIKDIFDTFDVDGNNQMDKIEMNEFLKVTLQKEFAVLKQFEDYNNLVSLYQRQQAPPG